MPRGWWVPQHPPDWVRYMAQAAGNRAMRQLLESPPLPPVPAAPVKQELSLERVPPQAPLVVQERPPAEELLPVPVREQPVWRRFAAKLPGWRK